MINYLFPLYRPDLVRISINPLSLFCVGTGLVGISFTKEPQSLVVPPGDEVVFTCGVNLNADHLT